MLSKPSRLRRQAGTDPLKVAEQSTGAAKLSRRKFLLYGSVLAASVAISGLRSRQSFAASLDSDLTALSSLDLSRAIQQGEASCVEVMQAYLARIHRYNPVYNAIVSLQDDELLLQQARQADDELAQDRSRGWMHGMPHAVKDLSAVAGLRYTSGSPMYAERMAEVDSDLAARIRAAGAIFIGKTNTPEFGLGSQSYNPVFGATGSAYNPALTSGGSSGGAASGLGTHMLPAADGSDMMGSLRNPGAFNNVIGFRPSTNVMDGGDGSTRGLSTAGPMGRNTADTIQLLQTVAAAAPPGPFEPADLATTRIGWLGNVGGYFAMEPGILELCEQSLARVQDAGSAVEPVTPRFAMANLWQSWATLRHSGRSRMREFYEDPNSRPLLKPELVWEIEQSFQLTDDDVVQANVIRQNWYAELKRLFTQYDFLALPTSQVFPFSKDIHWPEEVNGRPMDTYHRWMEIVILGSLGGIPVVNVPVGFDEQGRPMGMQIMGKFGSDKAVLEFALAYEQVTDHLQRRPELIAAV